MFFATLAGTRADTSYLLIQGPFGSGSTTETFEWKVNYQAGTLITGQDLLDAVLGSTTPDGTYTNAFGRTYNYYTAGNSVQGAGYLDYSGTTSTVLTDPFLASITLGSTTVAQDTSYIDGWTYFVAGGGSNFGSGYPNNGTWTASNDGTASRSLVNGSYDAWVYGLNDPYGPPYVSVQGANCAPTPADFTSATVITVPEPRGVVLLIFGAGGMLAYCGRRQRIRP